MGAVGEEQQTSTKDLSLQNPLSDREMDVARLLSTGASNAEIARELVLSPHTVKVHLRNIYAKLEVSSRTEASMALLQQGWLSVQGVALLPADLPATERAPDPEPLLPFSFVMTPWQGTYLVGAFLVCLAALLVPFVLAPAQPPLALLSDGLVPAIGRPTFELLPRWQVRTPLPQPRSRLALVLLGERLVAIGGETRQGVAVDGVDAYDLVTNQWQALQPLPQPSANVAAVLLKGAIYVAGGSSLAATFAGNDTSAMDSGIHNTLWAYNGDSGQWRSSGSLPVALAGAALVATDDTLYLMGGWDGQRMHDEVWRWMPDGLPAAGDDWSVVSRLTSPRAFLGAARVGEIIYLAGGYDGVQELADAAAYHLATAEWQPLAPLSVGRAGLTVVYDGANILALGGGWTQPVTTQERYDIASGLWSNFPSPITGEWRHLAAAGKDGNIHLMGGWSGDYLDVHLQYQSRYFNFLPVNLGN